MSRARVALCVPAVLLLVLVLPLPALAQGESASGGVSKGYTLAVAPGFIYEFGGGVGDSTLHVAINGEFIWPRGLGVAVDLGYITATRSLDAGVAMFSPGVIYEFRSGERTRRYVRGGYTVVFRDFAENLAHAGFGVNHQFDDTWGFKFEARNFTFLREPSINNLQFIIGLQLFS